MTGRSKRLEYRIVGHAVFPTFGLAQPLADGAAFTGAGYAPLFDPNLYSRFFVGRYSPHADQASVDRHIDTLRQLGSTEVATLPIEIDRLHQIDWLPVSAAVSLGGLALLAVAHALVTAVRRRRRELGLLKTLGFERSQVRATVAWQATMLGLVGLIVGIPIGVLTGDLIWRLVAESLGVAVVSTIPLLGILLVIPCTLALVNLIAFLPTRTAARTRPGVALRSE